MSGSVKDTDHGYAKLLDRMRKAATPGELTVGIHEAEGSEPKEAGTDGEDEPGLTVADVGSFHEFGLGVPRRSFVADWADENKAEHEEALSKMAQAVVRGAVPDTETALARLGERFVGEVQKRIADGIEPPLAQSTIDRKGSSKPLIATDQLRSSIAPYVNRRKVGG